MALWLPSLATDEFVRKGIVAPLRKLLLVAIFDVLAQVTTVTEVTKVTKFAAVLCVRPMYLCLDGWIQVFRNSAVVGRKCLVFSVAVVVDNGLVSGYGSAIDGRLYSYGHRWQVI